MVLTTLAIVALAVALAVVLASPPSTRPPSGATPSVASSELGPASVSPAASHGATPGETAFASPSSTGAGATATPADAEVLVGAGDIAVCGASSDERTAEILDELPGATVFTLGDNAYDSGTLREFQDCYGPSWGRHLARTRPAPGNHDYETDGADGYFSYFGELAGPDGRGWYAYDLGEWRVYSLNSNCDFIGGCDEGSPQMTWLRKDLADNPSRCSLAYWHHPRYSSSNHGSQAFMDPIWDTLHEAGVELVLAGHDHNYERFEPTDASGDLDRERGITSFVVGTGGRSFYEFRTILPTSAARNTGTWGVIQLTLAPDSWSSRFIPIAGSTFTDRADGSCH